MEVEITRDRYGYKIGKPGSPDKEKRLYKRVTSILNGIPKPWLSRWSANHVAATAISHPVLTSLLLDREQAYLDEQTEKLIAKEDADAMIQLVYDELRQSPWDKRDAAGDRGTAVHDTVEAYLKDEPIPDSLTTEDELNCAIAAEQYLKRTNPTVLAVELTIINKTLGYAGTLDLWTQEDGTRWIKDWKTSGAVYVSHAVQQVAYHNGEFAVVEKELVKETKTKATWRGKLIPWGPDKADELGIVHVTPEEAKLFRIAPQHHELLWQVFKAARFMSQFVSDTDDYYRSPKIAVYEPELVIA